MADNQASPQPAVTAEDGAAIIDAISAGAAEEGVARGRTSPVASGFTALIDALSEEVASNRQEFDRAVAFRKHVLVLEERWRAGRPPHTVRAPGKKAAAEPAPEAEALPSSQPSNG